jgi:hypothetical protein
MHWADDKLNILENLEFSVAEVWRGNPKMSDYNALRAYEAAFQFYRAESRGHVPKTPTLSGLDEETFAALKTVCEYELGRAERPAKAPKSVPPISLDLLAECLRELAKSTERHTKEGGRQGYLTFIDRFLPRR